MVFSKHYRLILELKA